MAIDTRQDDASTRGGVSAGTWVTVEALGIPDSHMRRVLFDLARFVDTELPGDQLVLASAAFLALSREFVDQFTPKSPLQIQVEHARTQRELFNLTGVQIPHLTANDLDLPAATDTPLRLAKQLGYRDGGRAVRRALREGFPAHAKYARWDPLTVAQVNYVRAHLPPRVGAERNE